MPILLPLWSLERPPPLTYICLGPQLGPHTTSKGNFPNYHFRLGLLYAADPPDPHHENPSEVFQSIQQTLTMGGHQTSDYIFYQILS